MPLSIILKIVYNFAYLVSVLDTLNTCAYIKALHYTLNKYMYYKGKVANTTLHGRIKRKAGIKN